MPFIERTDVGNTPRSKMTEKRRVKVWEKTGGVCVVCGRKIDGTKDKWIAEHIIPLAQGGGDNMQNLGPAHHACAKEKTKADNSNTAEAKRRKADDIGAHIPKTVPMPAGRKSDTKIKMSGEKVQREKPNNTPYRDIGPTNLARRFQTVGE